MVELDVPVFAAIDDEVSDDFLHNVSVDCSGLVDAGLPPVAAPHLWVFPLAGLPCRVVWSSSILLSPPDPPLRLRELERGPISDRGRPMLLRRHRLPREGEVP